MKTSEFEEKGSGRVECMHMCEDLISNMLTTQHGKRNLKVKGRSVWIREFHRFFQVLFDFIRSNSDWVFKQLSVGKLKSCLTPNKVKPPTESLLYTMFHIGPKPFDEVKVYF